MIDLLELLNWRANKNRFELAKPIEIKETRQEWLAEKYPNHVLIQVGVDTTTDIGCIRSWCKARGFVASLVTIWVDNGANWTAWNIENDSDRIVFKLKWQ